MTVATAKDGIPNIKDFLPAGSTSADLRAAFFRLTAAKKANAEDLAHLEADRPAALMRGQIEKHESTITKRRTFAEQCEVADGELRRLFTNAKEAEEDVEYALKLTELKATEAAWNADLAEHYPALAAALVDLLMRESDLLRGYTELGRMPGAARSRVNLGGTMDHPSGTMTKSYVGANYFPASLGGQTRLPNLMPGPALWGARG